MMMLQPLWDLLRGHSSLLLSPLFPVLFSLGGLPHLLPALPAAGPAGPQVGLAAQVQAAASELRQLGLSAELPVAHTLQPPGVPAANHAAARVFVCLLLFDFQSFTWHLLHHRVPWLYRTFHKVHHSSSSTWALTTEATGAMETLSLGFFSGCTPVLLGLHPLSQLGFFLLNIWLSVEDHCGYDLPWATHRLFPLHLYGGAPHHDLHHLNSSCNYAPYFTHWDRLIGTLQTR
ncbi:hypothetical protein CesoFtcFv8_021555 [Champsocephalus esox]|uniref:Fatty acid hydroxylase domain-containing protein n=1 Tax=Champsocephalus esox TaxID=159716 RepID=A0AAN8B8R2_9TELE|nr:hypothetical protein CesoFtcFv8_021555 [Champsocephalus esox]